VVGACGGVTRSGAYVSYGDSLSGFYVPEQRQWPVAAQRAGIVEDAGVLQVQ
jgi:hypothetical protein